MRAFFPEVQALRAIAVAIVVAHHLQPTLLEGGFIGVDVFFVISGYLITGHLLREQETTGTIRLGAFWAARVRRILPAALACIVVTLAVSYAVYPVTQWAHLGATGIAAALSTLNWVLAAQSVDYMSSLDAATPLQHFWSLGVEEQFYVVWPLVVLAAGALAIRRRAWLRTLVLSASFTAVIAASFVWSVLRVADGDISAYFTTTTRVWELAVGGALALWLPKTKVPDVIRAPLAWAGLGLIAAGALLIDRSDPFPGVLALVPVLGTVAVIVAGGSRARWAPDRLYRVRAVQWLGNVSYSLYLWHFPPIVLFTVIMGTAPDGPSGVALTALALGLAALSHRFIEQPARSSSWLRSGIRRPLLAGAAAVTVVCAVGAGLIFAQDRAEQQWLNLARALDREGAPGAAAMTPGADAYVVSPEDGVTPAPTRALADDPQTLPAGCTAVPDSPSTPACVGGDSAARTRVALVGDSHAKQLSTAIFAIGQDAGWRIETHLHASCPFNLERRDIEVRGESTCAGPNAATIEKLLADPPEAVVLADWASDDFADTATGSDPGVRGYADLWNRLADAGVEVIVFKDVPKPRSQPLTADCVAVHYDDPRPCDVPRNEALAGRGIVDAAAALAPRTHVVDLTDRFCGTDHCPAVIGNVLVYRDSNHVTDTYMKTLIPAIAERLPPIRAGVAGL